MQKPLLPLKEIIWEPLGRCENHCTYCGSKEERTSIIDETRIQLSLDAICYTKPEKVNVSGGDPLLLSVDVHKEICSRFRDNNIESTILVNPHSLITDVQDKISILNLYDWIGISLNNSDDIAIFKTFISNFHTQFPKRNITIITNFNLKNIFDFDKIAAEVSTVDLMWQIQLTVYRDLEDQDALYNNVESMSYLQSKIQYYSNLKIVIADNMNSGKCGAGYVSCGITKDGHVVPCLSMRSWIKDIKDVSQGIIKKKEDLNTIWENEFKGQRFSIFKCCKDICKNVLCNINRGIPKEPVRKVEDFITQYYAVQTQEPAILLYGVGREFVQAYAVQTGNIQAYAVTTNTTGKTWKMFSMSDGSIKKGKGN